MVKRSLTYLLFTLLILGVFFLSEFFSRQQNVATFKSYVAAERKISKKLVSDYYSNDISLKENSSKQIITTSLENLNYSRWLEYSHYISLAIYKSNILPGDEEELIVCLNLSKDLSVIAIYQLTGEDYIFTNKIENLLPIEGVKFIRIPNQSYNFLVTHQLLDERLGGFFIERFVEIYAFTQGSFKSVWKKTKYSEEIFSLQWQKPDAPPDQWVKVTENNLFEFIENQTLHIDVQMDRKRFTAISKDFPQTQEFKLQETVKLNERFYWSAQFQSFIISEGHMRTSNTPLGIIGDTANSKEAFLGFPSKSFKVIFHDGQKVYLSKHEIILKKDE